MNRPGCSRGRYLKKSTDTIPQRTRRIQVGKSHRVKTGIDVGTQCDLTLTVDYDGVTADTITEGENATEMEHAESDIDDDNNQPLKLDHIGFQHLCRF
jgi:hypothetical protein